MHKLEWNARVPNQAKGVDQARAIMLVHPGSELYGSDRMFLAAALGYHEAGWSATAVLASPGPLVAALHQAGIKTEIRALSVLRKRLLSPLPLVRFLALFNVEIVKAVAAIRRIKPDLIYQSTITQPQWAIAARLTKTPHIVHVHEAESSARKLTRYILALPLRLATIIVSNSNYTRSVFIQDDPRLDRKITVVYNGVSGPQESVRSVRLDLDGGVRIIYLGRISPRKGVLEAVRAAGHLDSQGVLKSLTITGSTFPGYEWFRKQLEDEIALLGLEAKIHIRDFTWDTWRTFEEADIVIVPSTQPEPFGNVAVEAVLAGRPVIASAIGGLPEALEGVATSALVPAQDFQALAEAVEAQVKDWRHLTRRLTESTSYAETKFSVRRYQADMHTVGLRALEACHRPA